MSIELKNLLTIMKNIKLYRHNTLDANGIPTDTGNAPISEED